MALGAEIFLLIGIAAYDAHWLDDLINISGSRWVQAATATSYFGNQNYHQNQKIGKLCVRPMFSSSRPMADNHDDQLI